LATNFPRASHSEDLPVYRQHGIGPEHPLAAEVGLRKGFHDRQSGHVEQRLLAVAGRECGAAELNFTSIRGNEPGQALEKVLSYQSR